MTSSRPRITAALALALAGATLTMAGVGPAMASTGPTAKAAAFTLPSIIPSWATTAVTTGQTPADQKVYVLLTLADQDAAGLAAYAKAAETPGNALYRQWLTKAQLQARYAPLAATAATVTTVLKGLGVTQLTTDALGLTVMATMPASLAETIFGVSFRQVEHGGESTRVATNEPVLPAALTSLVSNVSGLTQELLHPDDVIAGQTFNSRGLATTPKALATTPRALVPGLPDAPPAFFPATPASSYYAATPATGQPTYPILSGDSSTTKPYNPSGYTPAQIRGAYGVDKVAQTGKGVTIGIVDAFDGPTVSADLTTYSKAFGLAAPTYTDLSTDLQAETQAMGNDLLDPLGWEGEQTLDVEAVHLMAPDAAIVYSGAVAPEDPAFEQAIVLAAADGAEQVSNSYGGTGDTDQADETALDSIATTLSATGVGLDFSTGDDADNVAANGAREVDFPAASPDVTGVGGTGIEIGKNNDYEGEFYWGTLKESKTASGTAWDPTAIVANGGGGGGVSSLNAEPSYQVGVVPTSETQNSDTGTTMAGRVLPDVATIADATTGMLVGETQVPGGNAAGAGSDVYSYYRIGGTSVASPIFTGMLALVDQSLGKSAGFVNPTMYAFYNKSTGAFRDPQVGRSATGSRLAGTIAKPNNTPVVAEVRSDYADTTDNTTAVSQTLRQEGVLSTLDDLPGYDDSTGLGSPDAPQFIAAFSGITTVTPALPDATTPIMLVLVALFFGGVFLLRPLRSAVKR